MEPCYNIYMYMLFYRNFNREKRKNAPHWPPHCVWFTIFVQQIVLHWTFAQQKVWFAASVYSIDLKKWQSKMCAYRLRIQTNRKKQKQKQNTNEKDKQQNPLLKIACIFIYWCKMLQYYILRYFCINLTLAYTHTLSLSRCMYGHGQVYIFELFG